jgi:hypothetical protein
MRPTAILVLEIKLKVTAYTEADKWAADTRCEHGTPSRTIRKTVADK